MTRPNIIDEDSKIKALGHALELAKLLLTRDGRGKVDDDEASFYLVFGF